MKKKDEIDAILDYLEEHMPSTVYLVKNHKRYDEVMKAVQDITEFVLAVDENAEIEVEPDELGAGSISMHVTASLLVIDMMDKFCEAMRKANTFEVYPKTDGNIGIGFSFEGVYDPAPPHKGN